MREKGSFVYDMLHSCVKRDLSMPSHVTTRTFTFKLSTVTNLDAKLTHNVYLDLLEVVAQKSPRWWLKVIFPIVESKKTPTQQIQVY